MNNFSSIIKKLGNFFYGNRIFGQRVLRNNFVLKKLRVIDIILMGLILTAFNLVFGIIKYYFSKEISTFFYKVKRVKKEEIQKFEEEKKIKFVLDLAEKLSTKNGLPIPEIGIYKNFFIINAFTTGRKDNTIICLSSRLLKELEEEEIEGIFAHEFAHFKNRDLK
jgi:heat shock protein HtpX